MKKNLKVKKAIISGVSYHNKPCLRTKDATNGITLVALVVTIVVLLILAGITLVYVLGDNSIFNRASEAKLKTEIARYKEMLEMAKGPILINGLGILNPDAYFQRIEDEGIINNKDTDVIDNGDGTYEVTTKPGYVFEIELIPNKERPTDAEIEYIGQSGKLPPRIRGIKIIDKTQTSLNIQVEVVRLEEGKLSYYYKEVEEPESAYREIKRDTTDLTATIENLTSGKLYHIKATVKNKKGENTLVVTEAIQQLVKTITLDKTSATMKLNETLQLTPTILPENAENKAIEWTSSNEEIATVSNTGLVTAKTVGNVTITVKATDGSEVTASCNITVKIPVESVALDKTSVKIQPNKTSTLVATITPSNATNKSVTWSSSNTSIATVSSTGVITGKAVGTATITVTAVDDTTKKASCAVKVTDETNWEEMAEIAKQIANNSSITSNSTQATATINGESRTIKVGDIYKVEYNGKIRRVRVLGFKHDDLVDTGVYGGNHTKAGISFEFLDCMIENAMQMNSSNTNSGGWASMKLRGDLNGSGSTIGGLGANLSNKQYIKQVKKKYIAVYNDASSVRICNDFLWILAASETVSDGKTTGGYSNAITSEGNQYQYYRGLAIGWNIGTEKRYKYTERGQSANWWLRSPAYNSAKAYCEFSTTGNCYYSLNASENACVAPGFCL